MQALSAAGLTDLFNYDIEIDDVNRKNKYRSILTILTPLPSPPQTLHVPPTSSHDSSYDMSNKPGMSTRGNPQAGPSGIAKQSKTRPKANVQEAEKRKAAEPADSDAPMPKASLRAQLTQAYEKKVLTTKATRDPRLLTGTIHKSKLTHNIKTKYLPPTHALKKSHLHYILTLLTSPERKPADMDVVLESRNYRIPQKAAKKPHSYMDARASM